MPKNSTKTASKTKSKRRERTSVASRRRGKTPASSAGREGRRRRTSTRSSVEEYSYVVEGDQTTHVLVPVDEYERLVKAAMVERAIATLHDDDNVEWVDADVFALELASERIAEARKAAGLTQKQLGDKLGLPQSQISRIERNPDHTTVRTLKRIARALGVDVSALV